MKLFKFEIKLTQVNGMNMSSEHDVFVVADNTEQALIEFNTEFKDDKVFIQNIHQEVCKVLVQGSIK